MYQTRMRGTDGRRLHRRVAYVGNGGGASSVPMTIPGLSLWLDATGGQLWQDTARLTPAAANSDPVACWGDQSGNQNHAVQTGSTARPLYKTAVQNSLAGVLFDGSNDGLLIPYAQTLQFSGDATMYFVQKLTAAGAGSHAPAAYGDGSTYSTGFLININASNLLTYWLSAGNIGTANSIFGNGQKNILRIDRTGSNMVAFLNAVQQSTGSSAGAISAQLSMGIGIAGASFPFNGHLFEILMYKGTLTAAQKTALESYLNTKWAIY